MRDFVRSSLARSLQRLSKEDRLSAALPVVCGSALATHCRVAALEANGTLTLEVDSPEWLLPLTGMRSQLQHDLQRVAGVTLSALHFRERPS